jgi:hypothetical protein
LGAEGEGKSLTLALADNDDDATLAGLVLGKVAVAPILFAVLGTDVAAEIGAVHFHRAGHGTSAVSAATASRSLCAITKAVRYWTFRSRESWRALCPFAPLAKIAMASRWSRIGSLRLAKMVPLVTLY